MPTRAVRVRSLFTSCSLLVALERGVDFTPLPPRREVEQDTYHSSQDSYFFNSFSILRSSHPFGPRLGYVRTCTKWTDSSRILGKLLPFQADARTLSSSTATPGAARRATLYSDLHSWRQS